MKIQFSPKTLTMMVFICVVLGGARPCFAQAGTQKWRFQNRGQVRSAVLGNLKNLRFSYEIATCAARQGMIRTVLQTYEQVIRDKIYDASPEVCSSYALAHHYLSDPTSWDWKRDSDTKIRVRDSSSALQVQFFRDRALQLKPRSPEVLLSYALWSAYQPKGRPSALRQVQEAVRRAPTWADAHFWLANILDLNNSVMPTKQRESVALRYGRLELAALDRAEKLDVAFQREALINRYYAFQLQHKPKEALAAFDAYVRARPNFPAAIDGFHGKGDFKKWRDRLVRQAGNA